MTGKLFIFEGPDGVGKTTVVQALKEKFAGTAFEFLSFPGRDEGTLGHAIYRIHHDPEEFGIKVMSELARQTLHVAAHIDVIQTRIRPWIADGKYVVLDRFWWSTLVYGSVGGGDQKALAELVVAEQTVWGEIKPAAAFLIDRDGPINRREDLSYWHKLRSSYARLAAEESNKYQVQVVPNTGSVAEAVDRVEATISNATRP
ncbi:AAA family ATPase [Rhizobium sp. FY34]|uniref:dTMP kinase n=1 Tax=Rhizobium sp. FY34 TaxID=2562309 RepID=UPI0014850E5A|nr:AAA family ATPase [Rhizobium sp. FY34]